MKCETCHMIVLEGAACARDDCPNGANAPALATPTALEQRSALNARLAKLDLRMAGLIDGYPEGPHTDEERAAVDKLREFAAVFEGREEATEESVSSMEAAVDALETLLKQREPKADDTTQSSPSASTDEPGTDATAGAQGSADAAGANEGAAAESEGSADAAPTSTESAAAQEEGANEQA